MIVQWIVTGQLERHALPHSLQRLFPELAFEAPQLVDSVTSCDVATVTAGVSSKLERFATAIVAAADPGRHGSPPDLVIAVDDVELVNLRQPARIAEHVREAIRRRVDVHYSSAARRDRTREIVRTRCSFHLFCPMVEAYFFGEADALRRAGARRDAQLRDGRDLEDFETVDPAYLTAHPASPDAARNPKRYLAHLCEPERYRETQHGKAALATLDWPAVTHQPQATRLARSLLADLYEAIGRGGVEGELHPATSRFGHRDNVLRNC